MTKKDFNKLAETATLPFQTLRHDRWQLIKPASIKNRKCLIKGLNKKTKELLIAPNNEAEYGYWVSYKDVNLAEKHD